jgi:hypothetical protein
VRSEIMLASPAGSKVVTPGFARLAHFVPIAAIVIQTATTLDVADLFRNALLTAHKLYAARLSAPLMRLSFAVVELLGSPRRVIVSPS